MGKNIRNFDEFINESYSINEGKVFIVIMDDYDGKHNPEIARKYFSTQKKAEKWIADQGLEPAKYGKYITAPEGHIKSYAEPGGYGKTAELFQSVMENLDEAFPGWDRNRVYGMFNDHNGKPTKLSKEILDICMKGLPKKLTDNISDVTGAGWKDQMVTPPTTSNKGQSRGEVEYTTIVLNFIEPVGKNEITHITVGLRKRTSGPGTGYLAMEVGSGGHTVTDGEHAIEFMDRPDEFLGKLYKEKIEPLMK